MAEELDEKYEEEAAEADAPPAPAAQKSFADIFNLSQARTHASLARLWRGARPAEWLRACVQALKALEADSPDVHVQLERGKRRTAQLAPSTAAADTPARPRS
jgi:hypothetical protein